MQNPRIHSATYTLSTSKPGGFSLLVHILRGMCLDGMLIPVLLCTAATTALYYGNIPYHEAIAALLIGSIMLIGILRGCASWQQDLGDYQQQLAAQRLYTRQSYADRGETGPNFVPFNRY